VHASFAVMNEIESQLLSIFQETIPGMELNLETDGDLPLGQIGVDSLDKMSILLAVQEKWEKEFTPEEIDGMTSFNAIRSRVEMV
jgi:acyl carrier protein